MSLYIYKLNISKTVRLITKLLQNARKPCPVYRLLQLSMTMIDSWPGFQGGDIFNIEYLRKGTT